MKNNKLIAEFMGDTLPLNTGMMGLSEADIQDLENLKYHESWDWLMPVAEKIYKERGLDDEIVLMIRDSVAELNIESMYKVIVEFIKEYSDGEQ